MKFSNKVFILTFLFFVLTILTPLLTIRSSNEKIILPSEGSKSYTIRLKGGWIYFFEVTSWSGDEIINIPILTNNVTIFSDILRGDSLEGDWGPYDWEDVGPSFGNDFQVQETTNCTLIANVIASPTVLKDLPT